MDRRSFFFCGASAILPRRVFSAVHRKTRPNVLFISVDDQNDWMGCMGGHSDVKTPNYDRLAARGTLFTNAHCSAPSCNASRSSLLTGLRPSTIGIHWNNQPLRLAVPDAVTLPACFMNNGYLVRGSGKIFHGWQTDEQSWHSYWPSMQRVRPRGPKIAGRPLNDIPDAGAFDWGPIDLPDEEMPDWKVSDWVAGELSRELERPFFLGLGIYRPHLPWFVPRKYFDMYPLDQVTLPEVNGSDLDDVPPPGV